MNLGIGMAVTLIIDFLSADTASQKVSSFILEMWLKWHGTLWETCPMLAEVFAM